jgi:iduronate 2-sulfatase
MKNSTQSKLRLVKRTIFTFAMALGGLALTGQMCGAAKPNILFIAVDDLRPQLGCYGVDWMKSPNIDKLSASGVRFERHYVQQAVCIPSRVAAFTSLRCERTRQIYGPMRWQNVTNAESIGKVFSARGYQTASLGKIWHAEGEPHGDRFDIEWSAKGGMYALPQNLAYNAAKKAGKKGGTAMDTGTLPPITECADVPDDVYRDGMTAAKAIEVMRQFKASDKPFLLAVGFVKPHLPFNSPKKYWDLYDEAKMPLAPHPDLPKGMPELAYNNSPNFQSYDYGTYAPLPKDKYGKMPDATARHLVRAYAAAASYSDAQVGRVMSELESLGLANDTIVILWGDHGFFLGDLNQWSKHSNFERAARSPLIIRAPGFTRGGVSEAFVGTVDLLPTLLDLAGLAPLKITDGTSLRPLLQNPSAAWSEAAWHCFPRGKTIGFAVRTSQARYVEWHDGWSLDAPLAFREFYPLSGSGFVDELVNEVDTPAFAVLVAKHAGLLRQNPGFQKK